MGIHHSPQSAFVKEMAKWEHRPVMIGDTMIMPIPVDQGGKANAPFQPFPKMLYRAERADGGPQISGTLIVHSDTEEKRERERGWCEGPDAAIAAVKAEDLEFATLAANRAFQERRMSDHARAEAAAVDEATAQHVPVIPETPKRGRPRKLD